MLREEIDRDESVCSSLVYVPALIQSYYALSCGAFMVLTSPLLNLFFIVEHPLCSSLLLTWKYLFV